MRSLRYGWVAVVLAALNSGCTFYTACPPGGNNGAGNAAGSGNQGGTGNQGGSGNQGGTGAGDLPLLEGEWIAATGNLKGQPSQCGNLSFGTAKPDEDLLIMSVAQHGLWGSTDGGETWEQLGSESDEEQITNRGSSILFDPDDADTWWESGLYNGTGVFKTEDNGKTFVPGNVTHNDFVSVDFSDPKRRTMLASGHEQAHKLYLSTDASETWTEIGTYIPDEAQTCPFPYVVDADTFLLGCGSYGGGKTGIYRSTDRGLTWDKVSDLGGGSAPLVTSDGTIYWASESQGITKSTDQGETWSEALGTNIVTGHKPWELPNGWLAALSSKSMVVSSDEGVTWEPASPALPYAPQGFFYSTYQKAFFVYRFTCGVGTDAVPADGVMRFDYDTDSL